MRRMTPVLVAYHFGTLSTVLAEALTVAEDKFYAELMQVLAAPYGPSREALVLCRDGDERRPGDR